MAHYHCLQFLLNSGCDKFLHHLSLLVQRYLQLCHKLCDKLARKYQMVFHRSNFRLHFRKFTGSTEHPLSDETVKSGQQVVKQVHKSHRLGWTYDLNQSQCGSFPNRRANVEIITPIIRVSHFNHAWTKSFFPTLKSVAQLQFPRMIIVIAISNWAIRLFGVQLSQMQIFNCKLLLSKQSDLCWQACIHLIRRHYFWAEEERTSLLRSLRRSR